MSSLLVRTFAILGLLAPASADTLTGRIINPSGQPVANVNLDVIIPSTGNDVLAGGDNTDAAGVFSVNVPAGSYELLLDTTPVSTGTFAPDRIPVTVSGFTNLGDVALEPGFVVFAIVRAANTNQPVSNADVDVFENGEKLYTPGDNSNGSGVVDFVVPAGVFDVEFCAPFATRLVARTLTAVSVPATTNLGVVNLAPGFVVSGVVTGGGSPLTNADFDAVQASGGAIVTTCGDNTNTAGQYSVIMPAGTFNVTFRPSALQPQWAPRTHFSVVVNSDRTLNCDLCEAPTSYCVTSANSAGSGAVIGWLGSTQRSVNNFTVTSTGGVPNAVGLFYFGGNQTQVPFGDGVRCVAAGSLGVLRLNPASPANGAGFAQRTVNFNTSPGNVIPLTTPVFFQYWQRDPNGPGGSGFNLSNGLRVRLCQ